MKSLFRILIVVTCLGIVFFYSSSENTKPLEIPEPEITVVDNVEELEFNNESLQRPNSGLSTFIGQSVKTIVDEFNEPHRIEKTPYGYDWWIYNQYELYVMFGVKDGIVSQVYTNSTAYEVTPYTMYMSEDDIYRMTIMHGEISVEENGNIYIYTMSDYDLKHRILVQFDDIYAQLYIDAKQKKLMGIRFMDGATLVAHQPYEMQFVGELVENEVPVFDEAVNQMNTQLLFELTNVFRLKEKIPILSYSNSLTQLAKSHSTDMLEGQFVSHNSPTFGTLKERVDTINLVYEDIGENIATGFYDAIEAMHSLLNSDNHRKLIYEEQYTEIGVGVAERYYTQIFFDPEETDDE